MRNTVFTVCLLGFAGIAGAQEGHPVKGSWIGVWEGNEAHGENVLLILDWDGDTISGIINPGTDNIEITSASLNPSDWLVSIDAESADGTARYRIEGNIQDLELPNRSITGTWRSQAGRGNFEVRRQ